MLHGWLRQVYGYFSVESENPPLSCTVIISFCPDRRQPLTSFVSGRVLYDRHRSAATCPENLFPGGTQLVPMTDFLAKIVIELGH